MSSSRMRPACCSRSGLSGRTQIAPSARSTSSARPDRAFLPHGCEQLPAGLLAAAACLSAHSAVLVHLGVLLALVPAALACGRARLQQ
jgi:hypothetical protein